MRKVMRSSASILLILVMTCLAVVLAPASSSAHGFLMHFTESGFGNFNRLYIEAYYPAFRDPGISDFRDQSHNPVSDWSGTLTLQRIIHASGGTRNELTFGLTFADTWPLYFNFWAYEDGHLRDWKTFYHTGYGMTDYSYDDWTIDVHPVEQPEPITLLLFGCGLAALAGFVKRRS